MTPEPKFAPITAWVAFSGMTRTGTYAAIARGDLHAIKQPGGRRTLIDAERGLQWLRSQPPVLLGSAKVAA